MGAVEEWWSSYHGKLRAAMGDATLMLVAARGVIRNDEGKYLLIKRADNGIWAFPSGAMEIGESLKECAIRETYEETGLKAARATMFAFHTGPEFTFTNMFGDTYQHLSASYLLEEISGELNPDPEEASDAGWFAEEEIPDRQAFSVGVVLEHLEYFERTGKPVVE